MHIATATPAPLPSSGSVLNWFSSWPPEMWNLASSLLGALVGGLIAAGVSWWIHRNDSQVARDLQKDAEEAARARQDHAEDAAKRRQQEANEHALEVQRQAHDGALEIQRLAHQDALRVQEQARDDSLAVQREANENALAQRRLVEVASIAEETASLLDDWILSTNVKDLWFSEHQRAPYGYHNFKAFQRQITRARIWTRKTPRVAVYLDDLLTVINSTPHVKGLGAMPGDPGDQVVAAIEIYMKSARHALLDWPMDGDEVFASRLDSARTYLDQRVAELRPSGSQLGHWNGLDAFK